MTTTVSQDEITAVLTSLKSNGIKNVALTTMEGRSLGSTVAEAGPRFKLGALSAASVAIGMKTSGELSLGELDQIQITASGGSLLMSAIGQKALLSVVTEGNVDLPSISREMRRAAIQLARLV